MELFDISQGKINFKPVALAIPEFKSIWERDKTETKEQAFQELALIYFIADYKSPYIATYKEEDLVEKVGLDILKKRNFKLDSILTKAYNKYVELQDVPSMKYLKQSRRAADKLAEYLSEVDYKETDAMGKLLNDPAKIAGVLQKMSSIVEDLIKQEKIVALELMQEKELRGKRKKGNREDPE